MHKTKLLSICIPTYNRADFLIETLDSLVCQMNEENLDLIEICISDNCSSDTTENDLKNYISKHSKLTFNFNRNEKNLGADLNFLKVIDIAHGKYCWFLGSDDKLKQGALEKILIEIQTNSDIDLYIMNRTECDVYGNRQNETFWLSKSVDECVFDFSNKYQVSYYINHANSLGALFGYLSSLVFKKEKWDMIPDKNKFIGTAFVHAYTLTSFINYNSKIKYIKDQLVENRNGNDSFYDNFIQRTMLDVNGYKQIAEAVFKNENVLREDVYSVIRKHHPISRFFFLYFLVDLEQWNENIRPKLLDIGYFEEDILFIEKFKIIRFPILILRKLKKLFNKMEGKND